MVALEPPHRTQLCSEHKQAVDQWHRLNKSLPSMEPREKPCLITRKSDNELLIRLRCTLPVEFRFLYSIQIAAHIRAYYESLFFTLGGSLN